jgi:hypothetical protein
MSTLAAKFLFAGPRSRPGTCMMGRRAESLQTPSAPPLWPWQSTPKLVPQPLRQIDDSAANHSRRWRDLAAFEHPDERFAVDRVQA